MLTQHQIVELERMFEAKAEKLYNPFSVETFKEYGVKRGLRNDDGTGVVAGLTSIGDVVGYEYIDGVKTPTEGKLRYRGYDIDVLVNNAEAENRFGFEEVVYLLLFGELPNKETLAILL